MPAFPSAPLQQRIVCHAGLPLALLHVGGSKRVCLCFAGRLAPRGEKGLGFSDDSVQGSGSIKAGLCGGDLPECVIQNCVGRPKHDRVMAGACRVALWTLPPAAVEELLARQSS